MYGIPDKQTSGEVTLAAILRKKKSSEAMVVSWRLSWCVWVGVGTCSFAL